jgi:hypothetical protein
MMLLAGGHPFEAGLFPIFVIIMSPCLFAWGGFRWRNLSGQVGVGPRGRIFFYAAVFLTAFMAYFSLANGMVAVVRDRLFRQLP